LLVNATLQAKIHFYNN